MCVLCRSVLTTTSMAIAGNVIINWATTGAQVFGSITGAGSVRFVLTANAAATSSGAISVGDFDVWGNSIDSSPLHVRASPFLLVYISFGLWRVAGTRTLMWGLGTSQTFSSPSAEVTSGTLAMTGTTCTISSAANWNTTGTLTLGSGTTSTTALTISGAVFGSGTVTLSGCTVGSTAVISAATVNGPGGSATTALGELSLAPLCV
jgi:hypothetical protein